MKENVSGIQHAKLINVLTSELVAPLVMLKLIVFITKIQNAKLTDAQLQLYLIKTHAIMMLFALGILKN